MQLRMKQKKCVRTKKNAIKNKKKPERLKISSTRKKN